ncbi:hypothetical protein ACIBMZ_30700, partial [Micromonospora sp. NPDC049900]
SICCLTWSLAPIDTRATHTIPDLQDQVEKGSVLGRRSRWVVAMVGNDARNTDLVTRRATRHVWEYCGSATFHRSTPPASEGIDLNAFSEVSQS